ncbi:MAG: ribonuclease HII, partial [Nitriliruptoraceae bacterium]
MVAGIDEVGRGAWAGPVSVGIVALNPQRRIHRLRDSKALAPDERTHIAGRIEQHALAAVVGHASNDEIDQIGMTAALRLATSRALADLSVRPDVFLIDGNLDMAAGHATQTELIVKGDTRSASIAAASIVAKVTRDAMMIADD